MRAGSLRLASGTGENRCAAAPGALIFCRVMSDQPEYFICLSCDNATYEFEYLNGKLASIICITCGNEDLTDFLTQNEYDEMSG